MARIVYGVRRSGFFLASQEVGADWARNCMNARITDRLTEAKEWAIAHNCRIVAIDVSTWKWNYWA